MYFKGFVYIGFAVLFMRLGSVVTKLVMDDVSHLEVDHEQLVANTQSVIAEEGFHLPGVFIGFPTLENQTLQKYMCE